MKILVLTGSPHRHGSTDLLANEFIRGAEEAGHEVTRFDAAFSAIRPCLGCDGCRESGVCVQKDDMAAVLDALLQADLVALVTPLYYYGISAQLKAVIDRTVARWTEIENKILFYIMTAAEEDEDTMDGTLACFHGFAMCINGYEERGILYGKGVSDKGDVKNRPELMQIAYEMGQSV